MKDTLYTLSLMLDEEMQRAKRDLAFVRKREDRATVRYYEGIVRGLEIVLNTLEHVRK